MEQVSIVVRETNSATNVGVNQHPFPEPLFVWNRPAVAVLPRFIVIIKSKPFPIRRLETMLLHMADKGVRMRTIFPGKPHEH